MPSPAKKIRADRLLADAGLAESREQARVMIMEGLVFAPGGRVDKPGSLYPAATRFEVKGRLPYVGRGGVKLAGALDAFGIGVEGIVALDVGASTGGFTDCLLQRGAARVYALDVGRGQLDYWLRKDPRVVVMEKVNARLPYEIPEKAGLATIDVSFISLTKVLPQTALHLKPESPIIALLKPQFEARREEVGRGGVIKDPKVHASVLARTINWLVSNGVSNGFRLRNICPSPIVGDAGNREFFLHLEPLQEPASRAAALAEGARN